MHLEAADLDLPLSARQFANEPADGADVAKAHPASGSEFGLVDDRLGVLSRGLFDDGLDFALQVGASLRSLPACLLGGSAGCLRFVELVDRGAVLGFEAAHQLLNPPLEFGNLGRLSLRHLSF